jgi:hypothetical protein
MDDIVEMMGKMDLGCKYMIEKMDSNGKIELIFDVDMCVTVKYFLENIGRGAYRELVMCEKYLLESGYVFYMEVNEEVVERLYSVDKFMIVTFYVNL